VGGGGWQVFLDPEVSWNFPLTTLLCLCLTHPRLFSRLDPRLPGCQWQLAMSLLQELMDGLQSWGTATASISRALASES
jgi:hypothetical protein